MRNIPMSPEVEDCFRTLEENRKDDESAAQIALVVMAIGAGAMTVSHANDSYFWVVTNFGDMTPEQGYKTQTVLTLVMGIAAMVGIFVFSLIF